MKGKKKQTKLYKDVCNTSFNKFIIIDNFKDQLQEKALNMTGNVRMNNLEYSEQHVYIVHVVMIVYEQVSVGKRSRNSISIKQMTYVAGFFILLC